KFYIITISDSGLGQSGAQIKTRYILGREKRKMTTKKTILEVQSELERALQLLPGLVTQLPDALKPLARMSPPRGARAQVSLRHGHVRKNRQVKNNAPADSWSPDAGLIAISYDTSAAEEPAVVEPRHPETEQARTLAQPVVAEDPVKDLVLALAKAERDPQ